VVVGWTLASDGLFRLLDGLSRCHSLREVIVVSLLIVASSIDQSVGPVVPYTLTSWEIKPTDIALEPLLALTGKYRDAP
jgi:hypothetical protein